MEISNLVYTKLGFITKTKPVGKMADSSLKTFSILISGKVQGVFYRQSAKEKALQLGITGSIKNLPGKQVLVIASGSSEKLQELIAWCKQGPPRAFVADIETTDLPYQLFAGFEIIR